MKDGEVMRVFHDFDTSLSCVMVFTGRNVRIMAMRSEGITTGTDCSGASIGLEHETLTNTVERAS